MALASNLCRRYTREEAVSSQQAGASNMEHKHLERFSPAWWGCVAEHWNISQYRAEMVGFGDASFEVLNADVRLVTVQWDKNGTATVLSEPVEGCAIFSATHENWTEFVRGQFTAVMGVLQGRIIFRGSAIIILPYTTAFNHLAKVARPLLFNSQ